VAGFDLVGQEELGRPLRDFVDELLTIPEDIDFYFHAGETNWFGASVDENLIDAILLGTKRIGVNIFCFYLKRCFIMGLLALGVWNVFLVY